MNLGQNMTALIMQLQMAEHLMKENSGKAEELLVSSVKTAKGSMAAIREVVETLRGAGTFSEPAESLRKLISEFSAKTGAEIELDITGESNPQDSAINIAIYRIIQEAVTNAVRHGNASRTSVRLDYSKESIRFCVSDNGIGSENVKEGYGLKGIRERVEAFGGKVEIESGDGFCIKGILYLEGKK